MSEVDIQICLEEVCDDNLPSASTMAKNLLSDTGNILKNALVGNATLVPDELREARWDTCLACPLLQNNRCTECGCYMKVKVAFSVSKCPIHKW